MFAPALQAVTVSIKDIRRNTPKLMRAINNTDLEAFMGLFDLTCVYEADNTQIPGLIDAYTGMLQKLENKALSMRSDLQQRWRTHTIGMLTIAKGLAQLGSGIYLTGMAPVYAAWNRISNNNFLQMPIGTIAALLHPYSIQKPYTRVLEMPTEHAVPLLVATTAVGLYSIKNGAQNIAIGFYYREYLDQKLQDLQAMLNRIEKAKVLLEITTKQETFEEEDDLLDEVDID
jgi:hypothetical protein